jgi:hypothetical protein
MGLNLKKEERTHAGREESSDPTVQETIKNSIQPTHLLSQDNAFNQSQ